MHKYDCESSFKTGFESFDPSNETKIQKESSILSAYEHFNYIVKMTVSRNPKYSRFEVSTVMIIVEFSNKQDFQLRLSIF